MSRSTAKQIAELKKAAKQLLLNCERTTFLAPSLDRVRAALEGFREADARDDQRRTRAIRHSRGTRL